MIPVSFFQRDPLSCSRELIGCELVWGDCSGIIVETEAYSALGDEACHTFARKDARAFVENHRAGAAYIYLNYGIHWLLNVLVKGGSEDGFVLIRALEPRKGISLMRKRRKLLPLHSLCSGPGKLTQALDVRASWHGSDLCADSGRCFIQGEAEGNVVTDVRVGISKSCELPWRFLLKDSPFVSRAAGAVAPVASRARQTRAKKGRIGKPTRPEEFCDYFL